MTESLEMGRFRYTTVLVFVSCSFNNGITSLKMLALGFFSFYFATNFSGVANFQEVAIPLGKSCLILRGMELKDNFGLISLVITFSTEVIILQGAS